MTVPGNTQTARETFCHAQDVSNSLFCKSAKPMNIEVIPACEEGDEVPLHHGGDTRQCPPTPTKAIPRADLMSLDAIWTTIKYKNKIKNESISQYRVSPQGQFPLWAADPEKLLEPGWKFNSSLPLYIIFQVAPAFPDKF